MEQVLAIATRLCGDRERALLWFNSERLRSHDNLTPAELCAQGEYEAVLGFLADIEHGAND